MTLNEIYGKYKDLPTVRRGLVLIVPVATMFLFALMTAPHSQSSVRDAATLTGSAVPDCAVTKMRMSILGRSLMSYDWQSGNCQDTVRPRKVSQ